MRPALGTIASLIFFGSGTSAAAVGNRSTSFYGAGVFALPIWRRLSIFDLAGENIDHELGELIRVARAFRMLCHCGNMARLPIGFHARQEPRISA
ncbi:MAG: hypothetical protein ACREC0_11655 [Methylocella sp.]